MNHLWTIEAALAGVERYFPVFVGMFSKAGGKALYGKLDDDNLDTLATSMLHCRNKVGVSGD